MPRTCGEKVPTRFQTDRQILRFHSYNRPPPVRSDHITHRAHAHARARAHAPRPHPTPRTRQIEWDTTTGRRVATMPNIERMRKTHMPLRRGDARAPKRPRRRPSSLRANGHWHIRRSSLRGTGKARGRAPRTLSYPGGEKPQGLRSKAHRVPHEHGRVGHNVGTNTNAEHGTTNR